MKVSKVVVPLLPKRASSKSDKKQICFKSESEYYLNEPQVDTLNLKGGENSKTQLSTAAIATIAAGTGLGIVAVAVPTTASMLRKNKWKDVDVNSKELGGLKKSMCKLGDSINNGFSKLFGKVKDKKVSEVAANATQEVSSNVQNKTMQAVSNNAPSLTKEDVKKVVDESVQNIKRSITPSNVVTQRTVPKDEIKQAIQDGLGIGIRNGINEIKTVLAKKTKDINKSVNIVKEEIVETANNNHVEVIEAINNLDDKKAIRFKDFASDIITCKTDKVGQKYDLKKLVNKSKGHIKNSGDSLTMSHALNPQANSVLKMDVSKDGDNTYVAMYKVESKRENGIGQNTIGRIEKEQQSFEFKNAQNYDVSVMETKEKLIGVLEEKNSVVIGNQGSIQSKDGKFSMNAHKPRVDIHPNVKWVEPTAYEKPQQKPSIGKGAEIIIGLQQGRFCEKLEKSIQEFEQKIESGEIVLDQFVAREGAEKLQITMLAGGLGSRAEYTNASSDGIYHSDEHPDGDQNTKGNFRMVTGLTPMETTFITLHNAGILDCSKGVFGIGKNVRFYQNNSKVNKGNGGFTLNMYEKMKQEGQDSIFVLPNDSVSRMTKATIEAQNIINKGDAAIVMLASQVSWEKAKGTFGIMKLAGDNNEIKEFAEKPKERIEGFIDKDENCYTNTFQFIVHKDALKALSILEPYFKTKPNDKESRDWSKQLLPALMAVSQYDNPEDMKEHFLDVSGLRSVKGAINVLEDTPNEVLLEAKNALNGKKIVAVKSDEAWADIGQFDNMYDVSLKIASGEFKLEPWERERAMKCVNLQTGFVATSPELKEQYEAKYDIEGRFMAIEKGEPIQDPKSLLKDYGPNAITYDNGNVSTAAA